MSYLITNREFQEGIFQAQRSRFCINVSISETQSSNTRDRTTSESEESETSNTTEDVIRSTNNTSERHSPIYGTYEIVNVGSQPLTHFRVADIHCEPDGIGVADRTVPVTSEQSFGIVAGSENNTTTIPTRIDNSTLSEPWGSVFKELQIYPFRPYLVQRH